MGSSTALEKLGERDGMGSSTALEKLGGREMEWAALPVKTKGVSPRLGGGESTHCR